MTKIIVCRMNQEPSVEDVKDVYKFAKELMNDAFIETQGLILNDSEVARALWAENVGERLKYNRSVPSQCPYVPEDVSFVVDTRVGPPESYAKPGQMGYFAVHGDFVITKVRNGDGAWIDLSERAIKTYLALLALPKCARKTCDKPLAYPGAMYCGAGCTARAEAGE